MNCNLCGAQLNEGAKYCPQCGARVAARASTQNWCSCCGSSLQPGAKFCSVCGTATASTVFPVPPSAYPPPDSSAVFRPEYTFPPVSFQEPVVPAKPKRSKLPLILGILVIVAVIGVVVAGFLTDWFGLAGSGDNGEKKDEASGYLFHDNFTLEFDIEAAGTDVSGDVQLVFSKKHDEVTALAWVDADGEEVTLAIYDGYIILWDEESEEGTILNDGSSAVMTSLGAAVDGFTGAFWTLQSDEEEICDFLSSFTRMIIMPFLNTRGAEELEKISDFFNSDAYEDSIRELVRAFSDEAWLEEHLGYSTSKSSKTQYHRFEADLYTVLEGMLPFFEDSIEPEFYDTISDGLKEIRSELRDMVIEAEFGIKGGKLVSGEILLDFDGEELSFHFEVSDGGKTKIDTDSIEDMLDQINGSSSQQIPVATAPVEMPAMAPTASP